MKNILTLVFIVFAVFLLASSLTKNTSVENKPEGTGKEQLDPVDKLPKETIQPGPTKVAENTLAPPQPLNANLVHATSLMEPRPSGVVELTLTPENVPEPFIAFERNTNLTWQDFKEIKRRFEDEEGQPFEYYRNPTDTIGWNHWWVERIGVDEQGEDIYRLTDLLSFSESAFEILAKLQESEFEELYHQIQYGEISNALESFARELFPQYLVGSNSYTLQPIVCRQLKCLIKATYDEQAKLDIATYARLLEDHMESQFETKHHCSSGWDTLKPNGNIIRVKCDKASEQEAT
jgi:hypothetical protein